MNILEKITLKRGIVAAAASVIGFKVFDERLGRSSRMPKVSIIDLHGTIMSDGGNTRSPPCFQHQPCLHEEED